MKIIILTILLVVSGMTFGQFELETYENTQGIKTYAVCNSMSNSLAIGSSTILLGKAVGGQAYFKILYHQLFDAFSSDYYNEKEIIFKFHTSSGSTHTYQSLTGGYEKGSRGKYWLFINDEKLIPYFKKYSKVTVFMDDNSWVFSLNGFTSCYNNIF